MVSSLRSIIAFVVVLATGMNGLAQKPPAEAKSEEVDKEYLPLVNQLKDRDAKVRLKAVLEIAEKGEAAASTATALCDAIMDTSPRVGEAALVALEKVRPDLYQHVSKMILDQSREKQFTAIAGLGLLGEKALPVKKMLLARLRTETVTMKAVSSDSSFSGRIAGVFAGREDSALLVLIGAIEQIDSENADVHRVRKMLAGVGNKINESRLEAIDALIRWADLDDMRQKEILPLVGAAMQEPQLLIPAIKRLATFGSLAKGYLPVLKKLKLSSDEATRIAANAAVDAIEGK